MGTEVCRETFDFRGNSQKFVRLKLLNSSSYTSFFYLLFYKETTFLFSKNAQTDEHVFHRDNNFQHSLVQNK